MKTTWILFILLFSHFGLFAQCPSAGRDSSNTYCKYEVFDVADLRSPDADTNGVFIDPMGDTMTTTSVSWIFPGQFTYRYLVTDTNCTVDSARYIITVFSCWDWDVGLSENELENSTLIRTNPLQDLLILYDATYDSLEIHDLSGRKVCTLSAGKTSHDISQLQAGNYLLIQEKNNRKQVQQFIKY